MTEGQLDLFAGLSDAQRVAAGYEAGLHEQRLAGLGVRKRLGAYYTPNDVVDSLLGFTLGSLLAERSSLGVDAVRSLRVMDPACGSGNFLLAAAAQIADCLVLLGMDVSMARRAAFTECVFGLDIDGDAVEVCRSSLSAAIGEVDRMSWVEGRVRVADALLIPASLGGQQVLDAGPPGLTWDGIFEDLDCADGFDLVVGNPPFLSQLSGDTARHSSYSSALERRFGEKVSSYTDPAAIFLLLGVQVTRPGGITCLIEPLSILSARDAGPIRTEILENAELMALWVAGERIFDASVDVCAAVLRVGASSPSPVRILQGREWLPMATAPAPAPSDATWSSLLAASKGLPQRTLVFDGILADIASATADFRDQYYGLAPHVIDSEDGDETFPRLVTAGLIDPAHLLWGERTTKFNKTKYEFPRVALADLDPELRAWAATRLRPKLLLATQTKVLEVFVDDGGSVLPSVPVITVTASPTDLWRIGAVLTSPPVTLLAAQRHLGAALSSDALKLSAREVLQLPLPSDVVAWEQGASEFESASKTTDEEARRTHLTSCAVAMCFAYGLGDDQELVGWWLNRLPRGPRGS